MPKGTTTRAIVNNNQRNLMKRTRITKQPEDCRKEYKYQLSIERFNSLTARITKLETRIKRLELRQSDFKPKNAWKTGHN